MRIGFIHFHVLVMQSFQNSQVVKRQQVEEFARRFIFSISQAAVAVSKKFFLIYKLFEVSQDSLQSIDNII